MTKYKKNQVGITRHPDLYTGEDYVPVFEDVETELAMWKAAEKMSKFIDKGKFDWRQMMFIMHYVMCLQKMDDDEMYKYHSWQLFKISQSQAKQAALSIIGASAKQKVKEIVDDPDIEITINKEQKPSGIKTRKYRGGL